MTKATQRQVKAQAKKTAAKTAAKILDDHKVKEEANKASPKKVKAIQSRLVELNVPKLGKMPVKIFSTTIKDETFEHTDKSEVKAWRKAHKVARTIDPAKIMARTERSVKRALKVLGEDKTTALLQRTIEASAA